MNKARITKRRIQILRLIAQGYSDEKISKILGLHITNVKMQKSRLYSYLEVHSKKEALYKGQEIGLINCSDFKTGIKFCF